MPQYHMTSSGPKLCRAKIKECPLGGVHYNSIGEANQAYEILLKSTHENFATHKKLHILHSNDNSEIDTYNGLSIENGEEVENISKNSIVFPRNRAIPFGQELENEVNAMGSMLINSYEQHQFVSDSTRWRGLLRHGIPYWNENEINDLTDDDGPFFIKGETNALKNEWNKYCYAKDKKQLLEVVANNKAHPLLQNQKIIVQPFLKFKKLGVNSNNGQPVINEWRYFCLNGEIMASGFYWSQQDIKGENSNDGVSQIVHDTLQDIGKKVNYVAVDFAQLDDGDWKVIELNDGNMSGLCGVNEKELWKNIYQKLQR